LVEKNGVKKSRKKFGKVLTFSKGFVILVEHLFEGNFFAMKRKEILRGAKKVLDNAVGLW